MDSNVKFVLDNWETIRKGHHNKADQPVIDDGLEKIADLDVELAFSMALDLMGVARCEIVCTNKDAHFVPGNSTTH